MVIKLGCHGSTWELDYDKETDKLHDMLNVVELTDFQGIDIQVSLLGKYKNNPELLKKELDIRGLQLAALTIPFSWEHETETEEEIKISNYYLDYLKRFPSALMNAAPRVGKDRSNLYQRQQGIISCVNALGRRATDEGIVCSFHPSSPETSYFRTEEDYHTLFSLLDRRYVGYTPDTGHIAFGGMDVNETFEKYKSFIKHVHFKDANIKNEWRKMGTGEIDFPEIVRGLKEQGYQGWIMVEEETEESSMNPEKAIKNINDYVQKKIQPIIY